MVVRHAAASVLRGVGLLAPLPLQDPAQLPPPAVLVPESTQVSLCWQPYPWAGDEVIYQVERSVWWNTTSFRSQPGVTSVSGATMQWQLAYMGNSTHATIEGLLPGTNISLRVRWLNRTMTGPWSDPVPATLPERGQCGN